MHAAGDNGDTAVLDHVWQEEIGEKEVAEVVDRERCLEAVDGALRRPGILQPGVADETHERRQLALAKAGHERSH